MGLMLPPHPPFNPLFSAPSFVSPGSAKALKRLLTTCFAKMMLTQSRNRGFTFHQSLFCNTGSGQPEWLAANLS